MQWPRFDRPWIALALLCAGLLLSSGNVQAQGGGEDDAPLTTLDDEALLETLWQQQGSDTSVFDENFLAAVPPARITAIFEDSVDAFGPLVSVEKGKAPTRYRLSTATHEVPIDLVRDDRGLISGLMLRPAVRRSRSLDDLLMELDQPSGQSSWLLLRDGEQVNAQQADMPLAIGSAFKLWVLDAYRRAIDAGKLRREEVVRLDGEQRSWPSGLLQDAPDNMPVTLETLAVLMMSLSDNTATDRLIEILGRESVEALSPFEPLLSTAELFKLKRDPVRERRYSEGDLETRRQVLRELQSVPLPPFERQPAGPLPGVEWYASANALCEIIERVAAEAALSVASGIVDTDGWEQVAAKGGSETGVLNVTAQLTARDGTEWCLAVTFNGESNNEGRLESIDMERLRRAVASVIAELRRQ